MGSAYQAKRIEKPNAPFTSEDLPAWMRTQNLDQNFPGTRGFGYIEYVPEKDPSGFQDEKDRWPNGQFVIRQVEAPQSNLQLNPLDLKSNPDQREALTRAVDTGTSALSGPTLLQKNRLPGLVYFYPVYKKGLSEHATIQERRAMLLGVIYTPLSSAEILREIGRFIGGANLEIKVQRNVGDRESVLIYYTGPRYGVEPTSSLSGAILKKWLPPFKRNIHKQIGGVKFVADLNLDHTFISEVDAALPVALGGFGVLLTIFLSMIARMASAANVRAEERARKITSQLTACPSRTRRTTSNGSTKALSASADSDSHKPSAATSSKFSARPIPTMNRLGRCGAVFRSVARSEGRSSIAGQTG